MRRGQTAAAVLVVACVAWSGLAAGQTSKPSLLRPQTPLQLPPSRPLDASLEVRRELDRPIEALLVQGTRIWARQSPAFGSASQSTSEDIWHFDGTRWHTTSFYAGTASRGADAKFLVGAGQGVWLFGAVGACCGIGSLEGWKLLGRWSGRARWLGAEFPKMPNTMGNSFINGVSVVSGRTPVVCTSGEPLACWQWRNGAWTAIAKHQRHTSHVAGAMDTRGKRVIALMNDQVFELESNSWKPLTSESGVHGYVVRIGLAGRIWVLTETELLKWENGAWATLPFKVEGLQDVYEHPTHGLWIASRHGVGHFDGKTYRRLLGISGNVRRIAEGNAGTLWFAGDTGLYSAVPASQKHRPTTTSIKQATQQQVAYGESLTTKDISACFSTKDLIDGASGQPPEGSRSIASFDNSLWREIAGELHRVDGRGQKGLGSRPLGALPTCNQCLSVGGAELADLYSGRLRLHQQGTTLREPAWQVGSPTAASRAPDGTWWVVGQSDAGLPNLVRGQNKQWQFVDRLPAAGYTAVAATSGSEAWLAGTEGAASVFEMRGETETLADEQSVLDHLTGTTLVRYRVGPGTPLAVDVSEAGDLLAVGSRGLILTMQKGQLRRYWYRGSPAPWLHFIFQDGADTWVGGSHGTLLRRRGTDWARVEWPGRVRPTFTSMTRQGNKLLLAGPNAMFELTPSQGACP